MADYAGIKIGGESPRVGSVGPVKKGEKGYGKSNWSRPAEQKFGGAGGGWKRGEKGFAQDPKSGKF
jgi:hypothetical protein